MTDAPGKREPIIVTLRRDTIAAVAEGMGRLAHHWREQLHQVPRWLDELRPGERLTIVCRDPNAKPRPRLPTNTDEFRDALITEITRAGGGSDDLDTCPKFAERVAETIMRDYHIPPEWQEHFVRIGLLDAVVEILVPDSEEGDDAEAKE